MLVSPLTSPYFHQEKLSNAAPDSSPIAGSSKEYGQFSSFQTPRPSSPFLMPLGSVLLLCPCIMYGLFSLLLKLLRDKSQRGM